MCSGECFSPVLAEDSVSSEFCSKHLPALIRLMRKERRVHCAGFLCLYLFGLVLVLTDRKWTGELRLNILGNVRPKGNWGK